MLQDQQDMSEKLSSHHTEVDLKADSNGLEKKELAELDDYQEQNLTFGQVARDHPKIVIWSFFWCMCALGCERRQTQPQNKPRNFAADGCQGALIHRSTVPWYPCHHSALTMGKAIAMHPSL